MSKHSNIKILELTCEPIDFGGQEMYIKNLVSFSLKEFPYISYDILTPYEIINTNYDLDFRDIVNLFSLDLEFREGSTKKLLVKSLKSFFKKHKYDFVHIHSSSMTSMAKAALASKKYNGGIVAVHSHCAVPKLTLSKKVIRKVASKILYKHCDYFFSCSQFASMSKFDKKIQNKVIFARNGVDFSRFKFCATTRKQMRDKMGLSESCILLGNIGRLTAQKNQIFLLDVLKSLIDKGAECKLLIIGTGELENEIRRYARNLNICNSIILAGKQSSVNNYLHAMDVFLMPSIFEGLPISAVEAQANGLKVLLSENIDPGTKIIPTTKFLPISSGSKSWADEILNLGDYARYAVIEADNTGFSNKTCFNNVLESYRGVVV